MPEQKLSKTEWFAQLNAIAESENMVHNPAYGPVEEREAWKSRFEKGMTPRQAWDDVPYTPRLRLR